MTIEMTSHWSVIVSLGFGKSHKSQVRVGINDEGFSSDPKRDRGSATGLLVTSRNPHSPASDPQMVRIEQKIDENNQNFNNSLLHPSILS